MKLNKIELSDSQPAMLHNQTMFAKFVEAVSISVQSFFSLSGYPPLK